jgi:hypothetical protein
MFLWRPALWQPFDTSEWLQFEHLTQNQLSEVTRAHCRLRFSLHRFPPSRSLGPIQFRLFFFFFFLNCGCDLTDRVSFFCNHECP